MKEKAGWELREGTVAYGEVSDDQLWSVINRTFSGQSKKTTSYKYALIRAILESLYFVDENLSFHRNTALNKVSDQHVREEFAMYKESTVNKLYNYAEINGFQTGWHP